MLTQARLKELLHYDPDTGVFTRRTAVRGQAAGAVVGHRRKDGYVQIGVDYQREFAHRLAWLYVYGSLPPQDIDHIDRDPSNNCICNLRAVCRGQNMTNTAKRNGGTSQYKGVYWHKKAQCWMARLNDKYLGLFDAEEDAATAYLFAVEERYA